MQVAVIGGGVVGTCTAYFLAAAGHDVVVLERYGNVAQETSYGHAGLVSPGLAAPLAAPGAPRRLMSWLSRPETPVSLKPGVNPALWRWLRRWYAECQLDRFRANKARIQRLASYSQHLLGMLRQHYSLEYEQTKGVLQLFRSQQDWQQSQPLRDFLAESDQTFREVDADAARQIEPSLSDATPLAGALLFGADESGNCALFTRQMRTICQDLGVTFHFNTRVDRIKPAGAQVQFFIDGREFGAQAVVIAAGTDSARLLAELAPGLAPPLIAVNGFSATAPIKNFDGAPLAAVQDEAYHVAIARMGNRVRVAGTYEVGKNDLALNPTALRTLVKCGEDWFPDAANYNGASFWAGACLMLPDGVPLLGATGAGNVYANIAHGNQGWAMAPGAGKILADLVSGQEPEIDLDGLTLARYG